VLVSPDFEIAMICTRHQDTAQAAAARWGVPSWTTSLDLVGADVEALLVCGPPILHEEVLARAIAQRIPVFVEKPPARSVSRLDALGAMDSDRVFVDFNMRFCTAWRLALRVVPQDAIQLLKVSLLTRKPTTPLWGCTTVVESYLLAVGIHALDVAIAVNGGLPSSVKTTFTALGGGRFAGSVLLSFAGGRRVVLELGNYATAFESRIDLIGDDERACITNLTTVTAAPLTPSRLSDKAVDRVELSGLAGGFDRNGYQGSLQSFAATVRQEIPSESSLQHSRAVLLLVEELMRAAVEEGVST